MIILYVTVENVPFCQKWQFYYMWPSNIFHIVETDDCTMCDRRTFSILLKVAILLYVTVEHFPHSRNQWLYYMWLSKTFHTTKSRNYTFCDRRTNSAKQKPHYGNCHTPNMSVGLFQTRKFGVENVRFAVSLVWKMFDMSNIFHLK